MSPRRSLQLLALGVCLAGLAGYLSWVTAAGSADPFSYPGEEAVGDGGAPRDAAPLSAAPSSLRVTVQVTPKARLTAIEARPACRLRAGDREVPAQVTWLAGPMSVPGVRAAGRHLLRWQLAEGQPLYRAVDVREPMPEVLDVALGAALALEGHVIDASGRGVAGAAVWVSGLETQTDAGGMFRAELAHGGRGVCLAIRAEGMAWQSRVLDLDVPPPAPLVFVLQQEAVLHVRCSGPFAGIEDYRLEVLPADSEPTTDVLHYPFWWQAIAGGFAVAADGTCIVHGLPRAARLRVATHHPRELPRQGGELVTRRDVTVLDLPNLWTAAMLSGRVVDDAGAAVPSALVTASGSKDGFPFVPPSTAFAMLPQAAYLRGSWCEADAQGSYALGLEPDHAMLVTATAEGHLRQEVIARAPRHALRRDFILPRTLPRAIASEGEPALLLHLPQKGRLYQVRLLWGDHVRQSWFSWSDRDVLSLPLEQSVIADITILVERARNEQPERHELENQVLRGRYDLRVDI